MRRRMRLPAALALAGLLLAACGGGEEPQACDVASQKTWLRGYMADNYFWYQNSPSPDPDGYATLAEYFDALLYRGGNPSFPEADRWSFFQPSADHDRFFGDGETLGYGVFVAGFEVQGQPGQPLYVRYVEPQSPAALAGVVRGDRVMSVGGRSAAELITANDFSALTPAAAGDRVTLVLRNGVVDRSVTLTAAIFPLTPVPQAQTRIVQTATGRAMGYVMVKDMLSQALPRLDTVFTQFRNAGVQEVVLDLRYNGGGLVSVANALASSVAGVRAADQPFATLAYNDKQASRNQTFRFTNPASALGLARVYVLAGARTCSASEQVVNGLRPFVNVVLIGDTTCGKPVGFLPQAHCDTTYSAVNFESVNARSEGRYFDGFDATCPVAENFTLALGGDADPLLAAARSHADTGACPAVAGMREQPLSRKLKAQGRRVLEGEHPSSIPR